MMHDLRRCTLRAGLRMTVLRVLSGTGLMHGGVNVGVVHGRIRHIGETILGSRGRRGGMPMRAQVRADAANMVSGRWSRGALRLWGTMSRYLHTVGNRRGRGGGMTDVLETGLMKMRWNGGMALLGLHFFRGRGNLLLLVIILTLAGEIIWSFVFMGRAELESRELAAIRHQRRKFHPRIDNAQEPRAYRMRNTHRVSYCDRR